MWGGARKDLQNANRLVHRRHTQLEVDLWFRTYRLTFSDPTRFAETVVRIFRYVAQLESEGKLPEYLQKTTGSKAIYEILEEIRDLPAHRHREDAANILAEIDSRLAGGDELTLVSRPLNAPPPMRTQAQMDGDEIDREPFGNDFIESKMPPYGPEDNIPIPWIRVNENTSNSPPPVPSKTNLQVAYQLATNFSQNPRVRSAILDIFTAGTNGRGLDSPTYLDNPAEVVLEMPEKLRFLDDPIDEGIADSELLDETKWPKLDIYDLRRGPAAKYGPLQESDYIYQLMSLIRQILSKPEVARKYVIVHRAHPSKYQNDTPENFVTEEAPSIEEMECIIGFITKAFPEIQIKPSGLGTKYELDSSDEEDEDEDEDVGDDDGDDDDESDNGMTSFAVHDREEYPNVINVNGGIFDCIEDFQRQDKPYGHLLYFAVMVLSHEMGHYLNTCVWNRNAGISEEVFDTPRRMRWYQQLETYEYPYSAEANRFWSRMGEMGEVIEWLLSNYFVDAPIGGKPTVQSRPLYVTCWGSFPGQHRITPNRPQIMIKPALGERLLQGLPMVRIHSADEFREFIENEEGRDQRGQVRTIEELLRAPGDIVVEMVDVDQIYTGYTIDEPSSKRMKYRRASRSVCNQNLRKNHWKKRYCSPIESSKRNNISNRSAPLPPPNARALPKVLRPVAFQILFALLFLCCFLTIKLDLKVSHLYRSRFGKALVYFELFCSALALYLLYLISCISVQKTLKVFGTRQLQRMEHRYQDLDIT